MSSSSRTEQFQWQRAATAVMAVALTVAAGILHWSPQLDPSSAKFMSGMLWKIALVLALAWVAAPQLEKIGWQRLRGTMLLAVIVVVALYAIRPRIGAIAAVVLASGSAIYAVLGWFRKLPK